MFLCIEEVADVALKFQANTLVSCRLLTGTVRSVCVSIISYVLLLRELTTDNGINRQC